MSINGLNTSLDWMGNWDLNYLIEKGILPADTDLNTLEGQRALYKACLVDERADGEYPLDNNTDYYIGDSFTLKNNETKNLKVAKYFDHGSGYLIIEKKKDDKSQGNSILTRMILLPDDEFNDEYGLFETDINYYNSGELTFRAKKNLEGRELQDKEFTFVLKDNEGNIIQTTTNDENGDIEFKNIEYNISDGDSKTYTIEEVVGSDGEITYDTHIETVTVTTTHTKAENNSDEITLDIEYKNSEEEDYIPTFTNSYKKKGKITISKTVTGNIGDKSKQFGFSLVATPKDGEENREFEPTVTKIFSNGETETIDYNNGNFTLAHNETIDIADIPDDWEYTITENQDSSYLTTITKDNEDINGNTITFILNQEADVLFTNDLDTAVPTKIAEITPIWWIVSLIAGGVIVFILIFKKQKEAKYSTDRRKKD